MFLIEEIQDNMFKNKLINQAYILLFERNTPTSSPPTTLKHAASQLTTSTQSSFATGPDSTGDSVSQCEKLKFHFAVIKFLHNEKDGNKSQKFTLQDIKKSHYHKDYDERKMKLFFNNLQQFHLDSDGNIHYIKEEI